MKTNNHINNSEVRAEQVASKDYQTICLGADLHKASISVTAICDGHPKPTQRLSWERFWPFVRRLQLQATGVYVVYEAGAFGFWPWRKLREQGVECWVTHPRKLDVHHKRVQTDRLDSAQLADDLQRYVGGNRRALKVVHVPSLAEEQARLEGRHRQHISKQLQRAKARGRGLLLSQGLFETSQWWQPWVWAKVAERLGPELRGVLADLRQNILHYQEQLGRVERALKATAPKQLPKGFGQLTFVLLLRELCNYGRFKERRGVGGFTGLCGGVSSSGPCHLDLSINKAGSPVIRTLLIELAWRMIYYQPQYTGLKIWKRLGGPLASVRRRKIALVATARQLAVDIWRWQTGQVTAQELGWQMMPAN